MKRYKLVKDLPTFKAGDEFELRNDGHLYLSQEFDNPRHWRYDVMAYHRNTLKRFPNILEYWFEEIEEPKECWHINSFGDVEEVSTAFSEEMIDELQVIGSYFETEEEAEKAVEKLKAWKRLKDKGFRFDGYDVAHNSAGNICGQLFYKAGDYWIEEVKKDLDLLFGGEE